MYIELNQSPQKKNESKRENSGRDRLQFQGRWRIGWWEMYQWSGYSAGEGDDKELEVEDLISNASACDCDRRRTSARRPLPCSPSAASYPTASPASLCNPPLLPLNICKCHKRVIS
ncbi:hypothetical protein SAY87_001694 [Trapa incisa]|uniref:Uncharacterized protein n=1 Tax=Trapa incisa TaxID=236973 RepID=A0AAN7PXX9_9MYRT|nr:hypothetical protein SAY87_001694 [Trapa incisa]